MKRPVLKTRSARIRWCRTEYLKKSQAELAELLGVTRGAVGNWERVEANMGIEFETVRKLAAACHCSSEWILTGRGKAPKVPNVEAPAPATEGKSLTDIARSPESPAILDGFPARDVLCAAIQIAYVMTTGHPPSASELALVTEEAVRLCAKRQDIERSQAFADLLKTPSSVPERKDASKAVLG